MTTLTIREYLPLTAAYISNVTDQRAGHHNHVITQHCLNSKTALARMTDEQLVTFDTEQRDYLRRIDVPIEESKSI